MPYDKRPPKRWWNGCVRLVSGTDKRAVCGRIWSNVRASVKRRIRDNKETFKG